MKSHDVAALLAVQCMADGKGRISYVADQTNIVQ